LVLHPIDQVRNVLRLHHYLEGVKGPGVTLWISPRRSGLKWPESTSNRCSLRKQMTTDACRLVRLKAVAQRSTASWRLGAGTAKRGSVPAGQPHRGWPYEDLSRMKGNFHVRF